MSYNSVLVRVSCFFLLYDFPSFHTSCPSIVRQEERNWFDNDTFIGKELLERCKTNVAAFIAKLERSITRRIETIIVYPLHGNSTSLTSIEAAKKFLEDYNEDPSNLPFAKYEIIVKYSNGSKVDATFMTKL